VHCTALEVENLSKVKKIGKLFNSRYNLNQQKRVSFKEIYVILRSKLTLKLNAKCFKSFRLLNRRKKDTIWSTELASKIMVESSLSVIAPANTGNEINNKKAVIKTDHTNKGNRRKYNPGQRMFKIVTIKLIAPAIEEIPAICKLKMAISTPQPEWAKTELKGGYTVQPVPTPFSTKLEPNNKKIAGGKNQKDILFKRGKAISGLPIKIGTNQLPNAPIKIGITIYG